MQADDYFAIQNLMHRYCLLVDTADFDSVGALFATADLDYGMGGPLFRNDPLERRAENLNRGDSLLA
jgi:hypothetical protein